MIIRIFVASVFVGLLAGCTHPNVATVERFRAARERGNVATARSLQSDDPRIWFDDTSGPGDKWEISGGRWQHWDDYFHGHSTPEPWQVSDQGARVSARVSEINDYYRLTERGPQVHFETYLFSPDGKIRGVQVVADKAAPQNGPGRAREFVAWARENHAEEWAYLHPRGDAIDPTGDRPERTRKLLEEWRGAAGLPALKLE